MTQTETLTVMATATKRRRMGQIQRMTLVQRSFVRTTTSMTRMPILRRSSARTLKWKLKSQSPPMGLMRTNKMRCRTTRTHQMMKVALIQTIES